MKHSNDVSRRTFITTAAGAGVVAGLATVAMPLASIAGISAQAQAQACPTEGRSRPQDPLEKILDRYGSELGHVHRAR
jgi:hypothetical protein